jgi:hypothetical protein
MDDLTAFLLARIAEDEGVAKAADVPIPLGGRSLRTTLVGGDRQTLDAIVAHQDRHDPARVLAECEAKRRIVNEYTEARAQMEADRRDQDVAPRRVFTLGRVLCLLALPYAEHEDYREEWRP